MDGIQNENDNSELQEVYLKNVAFDDMHFQNINTDNIQLQDIQDIDVTDIFDITKKKLTYKCKLCKEKFSTRREQYEHTHLKCLAANSFNNLQDMPFIIEPWNEDGEINEKFEKVYKANNKIILAQHSRLDKVDSIFNYPVNHIPTTEMLQSQLQSIFESKHKTFKVNISAGYILQHSETHEYRYFKAANNNMIFDFPIMVTDDESFQKLKQKIMEIDFIEHFHRNRENSKWKLIYLTNIVYYTYTLNFSIGYTSFLSEHIKNHRFILGVDINPKTKRNYEDNLCLFRCLATHLKCADIEKATNSFFEQWCQFSKEELDLSVNKNKFLGFNIKYLSYFEKCFNIRLHVYDLGKDKTVTTIFLSYAKYDDIIYLNLCNFHFSYITDFRYYANKFKCISCERHFTKPQYLKRHYRVCSKVKKLKLNGGYFKPPSTIFDELKTYGIIVPENEQYYDNFAFFDFESILTKTQEKSTDRLQWTATHNPISVAIASNIKDSGESKCIVNEDLDDLLSNMFEHLLFLQNLSYEHSKLKWNYVFDQLNEQITIWKVEKTETKQCNNQINSDIADDVIIANNQNEAMETNYCEAASKTFVERIQIPNSYQNFQDKLINDNVWDTSKNDFIEIDSDNEDFNLQSDNDDDNNDSEQLENVNKKKMFDALLKLKKRFNLYCSQLCVFGFNSSSYDLPLIKSKLAKHLNLIENSYTIKKANKYICIANNHFRFLDVCNYLSAGSSYSQFLKAFEINEQKGFFPYEWLQHSNQLNQTFLPDYPAFYSKLKSCNVLNEDFEKWQKSDQSKTKPKSGEEIYLELKQLWNDQNMSTFKDFLIYYNLLDVEPGIKAIGKLQIYFREKHVDFMKSAISIPGIARILLFRHSKQMGVNFQLFSNDSIELYKTIKANIVGGPSIIYKREAIANETFIRNDPEIPVSSILGLDANALYLKAISEKMPTGQFVLRQKINNFIPEKEWRHIAMYNWMDWISKSENIEIKHKINSGSEKRIGPYFVDGFCISKNEVYEFLGCWHHFCQKCMKPSDDKVKNKNLQKKYENTMSRLKYIESLGFKTKIIWECEYKKLVKHDKNLIEIEDNRLPDFYRKHKGSVTEKQIINAVMHNSIFAAIEVDIMTPNENNLQSYFQEMTPIFCTSDIPFDSIGEHMQTFVNDFDLSKKDRRLLVGGMAATKILIASPLLKWYLDQGLKVTKIYKVIEYTGINCFETFTNEISAFRRLGDVDKNKAILGEMSKLLGNSSYGSLILSEEKHTKIQYLAGACKLAEKMNSPYFKSCSELDHDIFETELAKAVNKITMPLTLGFWILQLAKLHMLRFYYNCLDYYVDRKHFELIEMDTDSYYFSLAKPTLDECVRPHLKEKYLNSIFKSCTNGKHNPEIIWFPRKCCQACMQWDRRVSGLFKEEFRGIKMVALCSKSYAISDGNVTKFSCKGVNKRSLTDAFQTMQDVLRNKASVSITNIGFRLRNNQIKTYEQQKKGFTYYYCKRRVLANGIDTVPLDIVLSPWLQENILLFSEKHILSVNYKCKIQNENAIFFSALHMYEYRKAIFHNDFINAKKILDTNNIFDLIRITKHTQCSFDWYDIAQDEMKSIYIIKMNAFTQVKQTLLDSKKQILVECNKFDRFWGNGYSKINSEVFKSEEYIGRNYSGIIWQEIRRNIKCDCGEGNNEYLSVIDNKYICNICSFLFD